MRLNFALPTPLLLLALALVAGAASAQDPDDPNATVAEEITVTAQRVEEAIQDVPISIVTRSGEELERQAIGDVQALAEASPGVVVSGQSPTSGEVAIYIRGIGSSTLGIGTEPTVGYYVDGVYMPRPQAAVNPFLDLERIEILRGPQGTLWGRNSTAGAVNVVTRAPEGQFRGRLFTSLSEFDSSESAEGRRYGLSLTGPVSGKVLGRFTGVSAQVGDPTYNDFLGESADNFDGVTLRGSLTFLPSDSLTFTIRADSTDDDAHANFSFKQVHASPYSTVGTLNRFYGYSDPDDVHRVTADSAPMSPYEESGFSLHVNKAMAGGASFTSISSWRDFDSSRVTDIDASPQSLRRQLGRLRVPVVVAGVPDPRRQRARQLGGPVRTPSAKRAGRRSTTSPTRRCSASGCSRTVRRRSCSTRRPSARSASWRRRSSAGRTTTTPSRPSSDSRCPEPRHPCRSRRTSTARSTPPTARSTGC